MARWSASRPICSISLGRLRSAECLSTTYISDQLANQTRAAEFIREIYRILQGSHREQFIKTVYIDPAKLHSQQPIKLEEMTAVTRQILYNIISWACKESLDHAPNNVHEAGEMTAFVRSPEEENTADAICECLMACTEGDMYELEGKSTHATLYSS